MKPYRFLLFDADRTLLDFDGDMHAAFARFYRHLGFDRDLPYSPAVLACYERHNNAWWARFEQGLCEKEELFLGRFTDFLAETGLRGDPREMDRVYFRCLGETGTAYPGARELLAELAKDRRIDIITNGYARSALSRLENSGLRPYISDVFVSETVGAAKPDPRYFAWVGDHIPGFVPEAAVVIGDSLSSDIQGAVNAGLDSVWYCPGGAPLPEGGPRPTAIARDYAQLLALLRPGAESET